MKKNSKRSARRGFSLVELLMALAILALASAAGYRALSTASVRLENMYASANNEGEEAVALAFIAKDLRSATLDHPSAQFVGRHDGPADRLNFLRGDGGDVEYWTEPDARTKRCALWRRVNARKIMLCADAGAFELRYFDGKTWRDQWGWDDESHRAQTGIRGLPVLVSIKLRQTATTVPVMVALINNRL